MHCQNITLYNLLEVNLLAKYPLDSQEVPYINCLVKAPLGYHRGSTLNA